MSSDNYFNITTIYTLFYNTGLKDVSCFHPSLEDNESILDSDGQPEPVARGYGEEAQTTPARTSPESWRDNSIFSPSAGRNSQQLSSSIAAIHSRDAVVSSTETSATPGPPAFTQLTGTGRLMPPNDPIADFYSEPVARRRRISPKATRTSGIENVQREGKIRDAKRAKGLICMAPPAPREMTIA